MYIFFIFFLLENVHITLSNYFYLLLEGLNSPARTHLINSLKLRQPVKEWKQDEGLQQKS